MKIIIKNFPFLFYIAMFFFFFFFFLFISINPNMSLNNWITYFWDVILLIFFPMAIAVKNGSIFKLIICAIIFDFLLLYFRKCLIPAIQTKNSQLLIPKIRRKLKQSNNK